MLATTFLEYARSIERVLDAAVETGEATVVSIRIDQRSSLRGLIAGLLQFSDASELHLREFVDASLAGLMARRSAASLSPGWFMPTRMPISNSFSDTTTRPIVPHCRRRSTSTHRRAWNLPRRRNWLRL